MTDNAMAIREKFFSDLGRESLDLVILMERTRAIDIHDFYMDQRRIVNHTLRYYTKISPTAVRLAILTFARDVTVHVDGLSSPLYKCEIWEGENKYWDTVHLNSTEDVFDYGDFNLAFQKALKVFEGSDSGNTMRYLLLLTSGDFNNNEFEDPKTTRDALLSKNVTILGVPTGYLGPKHLFGIRNLVGEDDNVIGSPDQLGKFLKWTNHTIKPITGIVHFMKFHKEGFPTRWATIFKLINLIHEGIHWLPSPH